MTADERLRLDSANKRTELVRGQLVVRKPAGYRHGDVAARTLGVLLAFVNAHGLGRVFAAETGFSCGAILTPCGPRTSHSLGTNDSPALLRSLVG